MNTKEQSNLKEGMLDKNNKHEISMLELFYIVWGGKWWIIAITFLFSIAAIAIALSLPNEYKATAIVIPAEGSSGGSLLDGKLGGFAALTGIELSSGGSNDSTIAIELLKTWGFAEDFIHRHGIEVPLFAAINWERQKNQLVLDDELYDVQQKQWVKSAFKGDKKKPSSWDLFEEYRDRVAVSENKKNGLITISVVHYSPYLAKEWVDMLIVDINDYMKKKKLEESSRSIQYLEQQMETTSIAEIRIVFSQLIQEQHKSKMLAQVSDEFVFKTVSIAKVPEKRVKPKRVVIVLMGFVLGGIFALLFVFIRYFLNESRNENN